MREPWLQLERDGVRLGVRDFGGCGGRALLLHGLAGHAEEWAPTADWLTARRRVVAFDARGHGRSERAPDDVSLAARLDDAAFVIERMSLSPALVVGQSLGGHLAIALAARRPELVAALVVAEASPAQADPDMVERVEALLRAWPVPFDTLDDAIAYFGGSSPAAATWAAGLEPAAGGYHPRFEIEVMTRMLRAAVSVPRWQEWAQVTCPALIITGASGEIPPGDVERMCTLRPRVRAVRVPDAGHDVHLDAPAAWRAALESFVTELSDWAAVSGRHGTDVRARRPAGAAATGLTGLGRCRRGGRE